MFNRVNQSQESLPSSIGNSLTNNTRRTTQPSLYPPSPDVNTQRSKERSGSPLRHSISASPQSQDGSPFPDRYDNDPWGHDEPMSPTLGAIARAASSVISSLRSPPMKPSDEEIEAQAIRDREYSRREAERILTQEAEERRMLEERILAMRASAAARRDSESSLPTPYQPFAPSSYGDMTASPSSTSKKEDGPGWWQSAKNRLSVASGKEPLTPAQQIIEERKSREKDSRKKGKDREPKTPTKKMSDPSILHLDIPRGNSGGYQPDSLSGSPNASRENVSSGRHGHSPSRENGTSPGPSGKDSIPLYAKFAPNGTLDIPETLLTIARRFEKLERWTVGHVRALEDRVGDVEKWLVDKEDVRTTADEQAKQETQKMINNAISGTVASSVDQAMAEYKRANPAPAPAPVQLVAPQKQAPPEVTKADLIRVQSEVLTVKDGLSDLKSKMLELNKSVQASASAVASTSALASITSAKTPETPRSHSPAQVVSHSTGMGSTSSRSRLPYPTGDYVLGDSVISPPASPPPNRDSSPVHTPNANGNTDSRSGRKTTRTFSASQPVTPLSLSGSQPNFNSNSKSNTSLTAPTQQPPRGSSTSPTPRKRYTVALGGSIASPLEQLANDFEEAHKDAQPEDDENGDSFTGIKLIGSSAFSRDSPSPSLIAGGGAHGKEETIGGTPISLSRLQSASPQSNNTLVKDNNKDGSLNNSTSGRANRDRTRAQSAYGAPAGWDSYSKNITEGSTPPLRPRRRSGDGVRDQMEFGAIGTNGGNTGSQNAFGGGAGSVNGKFVDPLLIRKKERESMGPPRLNMPKGKTSFGDLLAFFDEKKSAH